MLSVVRDNGFGSLEQFAGIADRIVRSYVALELGQQAPNMSAQLEQAIQQIKQSGLPPAQQQKMIEMVRNSQRNVTVYSDAPEADKAAVRPHLGAIDNALSQQQ